MKQIIGYIGITLLFSGLSLVSYHFGQIKAQENTSPVTSRNLSYQTKSFSQKPDATNDDILAPLYPFTQVQTPGINSLTIDNLHYNCGQTRQELNQSLRELCAFMLKKNNTQWLDFTARISQFCNLENNATCWKQQALESGYLEEEITQCLYTQAKDIITNQIHAQAQRQATPL